MKKENTTLRLLKLFLLFLVLVLVVGLPLERLLYYFLSDWWGTLQHGFAISGMATIFVPAFLTWWLPKKLRQYQENRVRTIT